MERKFDYKCNCNSCNQNACRELSGAQQIKTICYDICNVNKRYTHRVNTSDLYQTINLPKRFQHTYIFRGYGYQHGDHHSAYKTSNSDYGWMPPNAHTVPQRYYPKSAEFSTLQAQCGMYRNFSLNTGMYKP